MDGRTVVRVVIQLAENDEIVFEGSAEEALTVLSGYVKPVEKHARDKWVYYHWVNQQAMQQAMQPPVRNYQAQVPLEWTNGTFTTTNAR